MIAYPVLLDSGLGAAKVAEKIGNVGMGTSCRGNRPHERATWQTHSTLGLTIPCREGTWALAPSVSR